MKVGIYDADQNTFPNLALMKISAWHKSQGDQVEWFLPIMQYDKVYASKVFSFSKEDESLPRDTIRGGTGYDLTTMLPDEIEYTDPDYDIYPDCHYSLQLFHRGCIRKCPFCVVPQKEGKIRSVKPMKLNPNGKWVEILDNNFFANPNWREAAEIVLSYNQYVGMTSGIDVRLITKEHCKFLNKLKIGGAKRSSWTKNKGSLVTKQIKIAWDNPKHNLVPQLELMAKYIKPYKIMCYVLIGYWSTPEEDMYRVKTIDSLGMDPFVMPFNKKDPYQKKFARWVNMKAVFKKVRWEDYNG